MHSSIRSGLHIDTAVAVLLDLAFTKDWFFSCRHLPSGFLRNRRLRLDSLQMKALSYAHDRLSPHRNEQLKDMTPNMYHLEYARIVKEFEAENAPRYRPRSGMNSRQ